MKSSLNSNLRDVFMYYSELCLKPSSGSHPLWESSLWLIAPYTLWLLVNSMISFQPGLVTPPASCSKTCQILLPYQVLVCFFPWNYFSLDICMTLCLIFLSWPPYLYDNLPLSLLSFFSKSFITYHQVTLVLIFSFAYFHILCSLVIPNT